MEQGIKFVITGDAKGLDDATKQAEKSIDDLRRRFIDSINTSLKLETSIGKLTNRYKRGQVSLEKYTKDKAELSKELANSQKETDKLEKEIKELDSQLKRTSKGTSNLSNQTDKGAKSLQNFGRRGGSATSAVTSFSQIIQDAPYGIRGVANNVEQLGQQFIFLSREAGGSRAALGALLGSLTGPAGILLAISAVSSIMVTMANNGKSLNDVLEKLGLSVSNLTKEQKAYIESIHSANAAVQSEISTLNALLAIARNTNIIYNVRAQALQTINDKYSDLLGNLDLEGLKTERVTKAVNTLTTALIKQAQVKALQAAIDEKSEEAGEDFVSLALKQQQAYNDVSGEVENLRKNIATFNQFVDKDAPLEEQLRQIQDLTKGANNQSTALLRSYISSYNAATKRVTDFRKETEASIKPLQEILQQTLGKQFFAEVTADTFDMEEVILSPEKEKKLKDKFKNLFKDLNKDIELVELGIAAENAREVNKIFNDIAFDFDAVTIPPVDFEGEEALLEIEAIEKALSELKSKVPNDIFEDLQSFNLEQLTQFQEKLNALNNDVQLFSEIGGAAISGFTQQLTQSLSTGVAVLDSVIAAVLQSLSTLLQQLIVQSITEKALGKAKILTEQGKSNATAITIATQAASAYGPLGAYVLPGLIASQLAIVNAAFAGVYAFAQGGIVGGGKFTGDNIPIFVNSGERILTAQDQSLLTQFLRGGYAGTTNRMGDMGPIRIEGEIRGDNIRLSNKRAIRKNRRFGSGING